LNYSLIASVLAQIITEFHGWTVASRGNLDDDVERDGFLAVRFAFEVIWKVPFSNVQMMESSQDKCIRMAIERTE
jgi:hypothetical protein